jgi:hypothetical protein
MGNLEAVARVLAIFVGLVITAGGAVLAWQWLRLFKIIRRGDYDRLQRAYAEHRRCQAEWDRLCRLRDWEKEIRVASRTRTDPYKIPPEADFDVRELVRNRR